MSNDSLSVNHSQQSENLQIEDFSKVIQDQEINLQSLKDSFECKKMIIEREFKEKIEQIEEDFETVNECLLKNHTQYKE